jgi:hypothetical protein
VVRVGLMTWLSTAQYDRLERAVRDGERLALVRHGRELVAIPLRLFLQDSREVLEVRHPTTGDLLAFPLDDLDAIDFLP